MISRRITGVAVAAAAMLATGLVTPAGAGVVCGGQSCSISLDAYVHLSGDYGGNNAVTVPPPPCWYSPVSGTSPAEGGPAGAAVPMDKFFRAGVKSNSGTWELSDGGGGGGGNTFFSGFVGQADSVSDHPSYASPAAGGWYGLDADGSAAGEQCLAKRPWLAWVPQGALPPPPDVPPLTLALYAFKHLLLPRLNLVLDPPGRSYVSLPTFVKTQMATERLPSGQPYRYVTASIPALGETVTVWALAGKLNIDSGSGQATTYQPCATTGSTWSSAQMAHTGANAAIDCGVTYRDPSVNGSYTLTASITWTAFWAQTASRTPVAGMRPVPGGTLVSRQQQNVTVAEIQNLNN